MFHRQRFSFIFFIRWKKQLPILPFGYYRRNDFRMASQLSYIVHCGSMCTPVDCKKISTPRIISKYMFSSSLFDSADAIK
jgi:hypothetical protein